MAALNFNYGNLFLKSCVQAFQCPGKLIGKTLHRTSTGNESSPVEQFPLDSSPNRTGSQPNPMFKIDQNRN
jgi:hypothetical protein